MGMSLRDDFSEIDGSILEEKMPAPIPQSKPLLPPIKKFKYTLVLDLDETLVHYDEDTEDLTIRPNAELFLLTLSKYYEIVIFTAGMQDYADWALSQLSQEA